MGENEISLLDEAVKRSLASFIDDIFGIGWKGREHEAISRYCIGHLQGEFGQNSVLRNPTQICIQGTVPGVPEKNPKGRVNKDLLIWPPDIDSCWDENWKVQHSPLCIQEWKVFRASTSKLKMSAYDIDWLTAFSAPRENFVGYAVSVDLAARERKLSVSRVHRGEVSHGWLEI